MNEDIKKPEILDKSEMRKVKGGDDAEQCMTNCIQQAIQSGGTGQFCHDICYGEKTM